MMSFNTPTVMILVRNDFCKQIQAWMKIMTDFYLSKYLRYARDYMIVFSSVSFFFT